jgi:hypothetical protein
MRMRLIGLVILALSVTLAPLAGAYWLKYYRDGQPIRESVAKSLNKLPGLVTETGASKLLNKHEGVEPRSGPTVSPAARLRRRSAPGRPR